MATTLETSSSAEVERSRLRHVAVVRLEVVQIWAHHHAGGGDILDLVSADLCLFARDGLDGAGV